MIKKLSTKLTSILLHFKIINFLKFLNKF